MWDKLKVLDKVQPNPSYLTKVDNRVCLTKGSYANPKCDPNRSREADLGEEVEEKREEEEVVIEEVAADEEVPPPAEEEEEAEAPEEVPTAKEGEE